MIFTDPPYNVDYTGHTEESLKIENDKLKNEDFFKLLLEAFKRMAENTLQGGGGVYLPCGHRGFEFQKGIYRFWVCFEASDHLEKKSLRTW